MSVRTRIKLIVICIATAVLSLLAGCSIGEETVDSFLNGKNARDQVVTYYANGGKFNGTGNIITKDIYYVEGAYVININVAQDVNSIYVSRNGYIFDGWYYAEVDEEGNPVLDSNDNYVITDVPVDFNKTIQKGDHWYFCAKWEADVNVEIRLVSDEAITGADGKTYENGDTISTKNFGTSGTVTLSVESTPMASSDHTFLQYYYDADCTTPISDPISKPEDSSVKSVPVYAKYIEGVWTIVRNSSDVVKMLNNTASDTNYYLFSATGETVIDCTGKMFAPKPDQFNSRIEGNGFTIKNLTYTATSVAQGSVYSLFGEFTKNASVSNLTIENVTFTASVRGNSYMYLVCSGIESGASFENFSIENAEMSLSFGDTTQIINIQSKDGVYNTDNWMFGGVSDQNENQTDSAFLSEYSGITVSATLKINNQTVVSD